MLKGIIFDMDGVLVNNMHVHIEAFDIFCRRYGVTGWQEKIAGSIGMGNDDIMRLVLPAEILGRKTLREWGAEKEAVYREIYAPTIKPFTGLVALLEAAAAAGLKCAVGSSGCTENVNFVLDKCGIARLFSARVSGDDVTRCKPDPEIYLTAARKLGFEPSECLVFEDAKAGIEAACNAGMKVVALTTTSPRAAVEAMNPDRIIDDFTQISIEELQRMF